MSQQLKFIIPQNLDDLLHPQEDLNIYYVTDELTSLEINQILSTTEGRLRENPLAIEEEFKVFFSVLRNIKNIDRRIIDKCWQIITRTSHSYQESLREIFIISLDDVTNGSPNEDEAEASLSSHVNLFQSLQEKLAYSNAFKMLVYLNFNFITHYEDLLTSQNHLEVFNEANAKHKKKSKKDDACFKDYDRYKATGVKTLLHLANMPLVKLLETPTEARDVVNLFMRICYKMIENSAINNLTKSDNKELLEYIFIILGTGIQNYQQSLSFCLKFIQLLQSREQLAPLLASLVEYIVTKHDQKLLIGDILREIDRIDIKDLSRDSSCPRAVSTFLVTLSEKCAEDFIPLRTHLLDYLEQDSYIMRNASLSIITNIILSLQEKEDEKALRDELLDVMLDHTQDITGYTRSKCLSLWCHLCEKKCIPLSFMTRALGKAVERLQDKSCLVRKNALKFISSMLESNPYAPKLPLTRFVNKLQELKDNDEDDKIASYLRDVIKFTVLIHKAIQPAMAMLTSTNITDTQEAIDFFVLCHEFGIEEASIGLRRLILLINTQEQSIRDVVTAAYRRIFIDRHEGKAALIISHFSNFLSAATIGETIALQKLIKIEDFNKELQDELWARFTRTKTCEDEDAIAAIQLLGMLASTQQQIIEDNLHICLQYGLVDATSEQQSRLIRETCIAIKQLKPKQRLPKNHPIFLKSANILIDSLNTIENLHWFSMCDEIIKMIFEMAEKPEKICETIFASMLNKLLVNSVQANSTENLSVTPDLVFHPSTISGSTPAPTAELVHPIVLARYIHCLGAVALNLAVFLEVHVLLELKKRNAPDANISAHNISISSRRRSRKYTNLEEEIGLAGAEAEDVEVEFIGQLCDEDIVCGKNMLARASRLIIEVVTEPLRYPALELKLASSLALARYMMVSAKYCHNHLRLLFTILEKSRDQEVKINLLIAIGDLCVRFPNQMDGWTSKIFDCLQSEEVLVRRTALKILSRLVLSDNLKAKEQISLMANLIVDPDEQISALARNFFQELSKKLNAIYNFIPDIISRLSGNNQFRAVMLFVFNLIDKSQHVDRLVDKLCGRFMETVDEGQWCDLAYCLTLLKYSDKSIVKLFDKFDCYKDKLCIDSVQESIHHVIQTYKKTPNLKNEMKLLLEEFEAKLGSPPAE